MNRSPILFLLLIGNLFFFPFLVRAQELHKDLQGVWRAKVIEITAQKETIIPGTDTVAMIQTIQAEIIDGGSNGKIITVENDYLSLQEGDFFFVNYLITIQGDEIYTVADADRRSSLLFFVALFIGVILFFGGKQGARSLLALLGSFFVISYLLIPTLLQGYSPVLTSSLFAVGILFIAIFFTHGWNRVSVVAFLGTSCAMLITTILAFIAVKTSSLSGFGSDESVFLNMNTGGKLDFSGLLLGGIIIGVLGVLDDIAITQAAVVSELFHANKNLSKKEVYQKALRIGREHVGALVNTLALAYTGASLPLLLLFQGSSAEISYIINGEIFSTEIIRTIVGSIGLVLAVPITTFLAVHMLKDHPQQHHGHTHNHS